MTVPSGREESPRCLLAYRHQWSIELFLRGTFIAGATHAQVNCTSCAVSFLSQRWALINVPCCPVCVCENTDAQPFARITAPSCTVATACGLLGTVSAQGRCRPGPCPDASLQLCWAVRRRLVAWCEVIVRSVSHSELSFRKSRTSFSKSSSTSKQLYLGLLLPQCLLTSPWKMQRITR